MAGFTTTNNEHLIRSNLWSTDLKKILEPDLMGTKWVRMITDFPDGDTLNIPSIGQATVNDYAEGQAVLYTAMDTGNFTFTINKYKSTATYITEKMKQDSFYMSQLVSSFVPEQAAALARAMEVDILATGPDGQTSADLNTINGGDHRWVGQGANETMSVMDFAKALHSLQVANVPMTNLVAIVDPSVEYALNTIPNIANMSNNPHWEGVVSSGLSKGMRFMKNIYGFDVYVSQYLKGSIAETINGLTTTVAKANMFFSATPGMTLPLIGLIRQSPKVDSEYNKDFQREEYVTTCRYGFKLFRPENMVVVLTDTNQVG